MEFTFDLAGPVSRFVAVVTDHLLLLAGLGLLWGAALTAGLALFFISLPLAMLITFLFYFGYFTYFEWKWNGQTPGKRLADIRVIDDRGMSPDFFQLMVRNLLRVVDLLPALVALDYIGIGFYAVGGLVFLLHPRSKRLGDMAAGTMVVRNLKPPAPAAILATTEKYNTLQEDGVLRGRIRTRLTLEERETLFQLCLRRNELEFEARTRLFEAAAAWLSSRMDIRREEFMSEEKFVQNITAVALAESSRLRDRMADRTQPGLPGALQPEKGVSA